MRRASISILLESILHYDIMVQTYSDGTYIYLVDLMFRYVNNPRIRSKKIKLSKLFPQLKHNAWNNGITAMNVINNPEISPKDWERIQHADLRYPIMIDGRKDTHHNFNIVDGIHRLAKAYLKGKKEIRAYVFSPELMKKFIISKYSNSLTNKDIDKIFQERFK